MQANDLELSDLLTVGEGALSIYDQQLVLQPVPALGQFRKDLLAMLGTEHTRRLFTRFGFFWGQSDAATMKRALRWNDRAELIRAGVRLQAIGGGAEISILKLDFSPVGTRFQAECLWRRSTDSDEHIAEIGRADEPICWKLVGYLSGFVSLCTGERVYFVEGRCRAQGHEFCTAIGKDRDSWGDEIAGHLPYFESRDILGRIERLSDELERKSRLLSRRGRRFSALRHRTAPFLSEGRSDALYRVINLAERVSQFDSSVLITGETGVGKEVLARYIHQMSHRSTGEFVTINCGGLPESLLESELFGHKAGSFTGAVRDRIGLFEEAAGGTVFLDEVGDIGLPVQAKLLRVLQEKMITRVGENQTRPIDVRIIAATNRDLNEAVAAGSFRDDLLYRLRVIEIEIPPLRERPEDILPLARYLLGRLSKRFGLLNLRLDAACADCLQAYSWPGNVRELENALERATVLSPEGVILPNYLPPHLLAETARQMSHSRSHSKTLERAVLDHIQAVLRSTGNNRRRAAKILDISPATLWRKLKRAGG